MQQVCSVAADMLYRLFCFVAGLLLSMIKVLDEVQLAIFLTCYLCGAQLICCYIFPLMPYPAVNLILPV